MKPRRIVILLFLLVIALIWLALSRESEEVKKSEEAATVTAVDPKVLPTVRYEAEQAKPPTPPTVSTVRQEVEADPHAPPISIVEFAERLAPRLESALQNEKDARIFFSFLEDCVRGQGDEQVSEVARALCFKNAQVLSERYVSLQPRFKDLRASVETRILQLAE